MTAAAEAAALVDVFVAHREFGQTEEQAKAAAIAHADSLVDLAARSLASANAVAAAVRLEVAR